MTKPMTDERTADVLEMIVEAENAPRLKAEVRRLRKDKEQLRKENERLKQAICSDDDREELSLDDYIGLAEDGRHHLNTNPALVEKNERLEKTIGELGLYVAKLRKVVEAARDHTKYYMPKALGKALRDLDEEKP